MQPVLETRVLPRGKKNQNLNTMSLKKWKYS